MPSVHINVKGIVQGVNFRYHAKEVASKLGLKGVVRNLSDGSVEVIAEGVKDNLHQLVEWCHHGPAHAIVESVKVKPISTEKFWSFIKNRKSHSFSILH
ncbi:acylphosphatase [Candidatus Woesearchaeota archaeon]|nr:acylphosphatase [Candidatus Woesearchaeota archaeon]